MPNESVVKMLTSMSKLLGELDPITSPLRLMQTLVLDHFRAMPIAEERMFGFGGVQQFILDMQFMLACLDQFVTEECNGLANDMCGAALRQYFAQNKDMSTPLKVTLFACVCKC